MSQTVQRIETERGSHIEPPLEQWWSHLRKLQWHAAVCSVDTGLAVSVAVSNYSTKYGPVWVRNWGYYDVSIPGSTSGPYRYDEAWTLINGISMGANAHPTPLNTEREE